MQVDCLELKKTIVLDIPLHLNIDESAHDMILSFELLNLKNYTLSNLCIFFLKFLSEFVYLTRGTV